MKKYFIPLFITTFTKKFGHAYRKIRAAKPDKYDIKYLDAKSDDPMLELEQIIWLTNGQP